jgi:hypothetical protein
MNIVKVEALCGSFSPSEVMKQNLIFLLTQNYDERRNHSYTGWSSFGE